MDKLHPLMEWAVWGNLESQKNLELILLKGHLFLEVVIDFALSANGIERSENFSFYRKVSELKKIEIQDVEKRNFIIELLFDINQLRNRMAHEWQFDIYSGEFESWSLGVLQNFDGTKFSKYTYRTKIVHAFSILTKSLLELGEKPK